MLNDLDELCKENEARRSYVKKAFDAVFESLFTTDTDKMRRKVLDKLQERN